MNLTYNNYPELKINIPWNKLPSSISDAKDELADYHEFYKDDPDMKKAFDGIAAVINRTGVFKPKKKKTSVEKKETQKPNQKAKSKAKAKKTTAKPKQDDILKVPTFSEEVKIFRRFINLQGKSKKKSSFILLRNFIQRAILEKRLTSKSKYKYLMNEVIRWIDRVLLNMIEEEINQGVFQMADEKTLDKIREVVASEKVYPAIYIIKAFIGLQGKKPSLDKARRLLKRINGGIQAKRIDPKFKKDINRIKGVLEKYVDERTATVDIDQQTLNGLNCACEGYDDIKIGDLGIEESEDLNNTYTVKKKSNPSDLSNPAFVNQMEIYPTPVNRTSFNQVSPTYTNGSRSVNNGSYLPSNVTSGASTLDGFTSSNQLAPSGNVERFEGPMGIFIGDMESNEYAICLKGDQGGGKSQLAFQLADEFLSMGKTVGFLSLEMAPNSHKVINYRDKYIKPENQSRFSISGKADDGIMSVRRAAEQFDVIVLDSWQGLDENSKEFGKLRKDFPQTKFVVIFQSTSGNTVRGGTRPLFDCDVVIHVHKHENGFEHNYAICEKNRMHTEGIRYIVASRSVNEGSVVPMLKTFN